MDDRCDVCAHGPSNHDKFGCRLCRCAVAVLHGLVEESPRSAPERLDHRARRGRQIQDIPLPGEKLKPPPKPKMTRTGHCGRCGKNRYAGTEYFVFDRAYDRKLFVCQRCGRRMAAMSGYEAEQSIYMEGGA